MIAPHSNPGAPPREDWVTPLTEFAATLKGKVMWDDEWVHWLQSLSGNVGWSRCGNAKAFSKSRIVRVDKNVSRFQTCGVRHSERKYPLRSTFALI